MKYHIEFDLDFKRNSYPGKLIAIEGIDGSGKTTQVDLVTHELLKNHKVYVTKNPTDGIIGKFIRQVLSGEIELPSVSFQYLFSADRQVQQVGLLKRLEKGEYIITDRYFWSALAYGIVDRIEEEQEKAGKQILIAQGLLSHYHQFMIPDVTVYLDISVETAMNRLQGVKQKEIYEEKGKLTSIRQAYEWIKHEFPDEITTIDGQRNMEDITNDIVGIIKKKVDK